MDDKPYVTDPTFPEGLGIVRRMGWHNLKRERRFRLIIEFPNGPPSLPIGTVWNKLPVSVALATKANLQCGEGKS